MISFITSPRNSLFFLAIAGFFILYHFYTVSDYVLPFRGLSKSPKAKPELNSYDEQFEGGPRVVQATMVYESDHAPHYERALDTHIKHGEKWGYPTHVLRHDLINADYFNGKAFFNKPAYLLSLILKELANPPGRRAEWIV